MLAHGLQDSLGGIVAFLGVKQEQVSLSLTLTVSVRISLQESLDNLGTIPISSS